MSKDGYLGDIQTPACIDDRYRLSKKTVVSNGSPFEDMMAVKKILDEMPPQPPITIMEASTYADLLELRRRYGRMWFIGTDKHCICINWGRIVDLIRRRK